MVAAGAAAAVAVGLLQSGGLLVPGRVAPRLERLDPAAGLSGLVSAARLVGVLRALLAALLVSWLVIRSLRAAAPGLAHGVGELAAVSALAGDVALELGGYAALLGLSLGALDLWVVRRAWLRRFRMSKDEVRREYRESEGDPELKAARRRAHREVLVSQQLHAVKSASVVIVNPTHLATALRYDQEQEGAPEVVAQGQGDVARRILDAARAYGVPVIRNVPLARALQELEVGSEIPELLYEAVAEVLREVWESR
jgi:flagellar biosynthesis protein FlhB